MGFVQLTHFADFHFFYSPTHTLHPPPPLFHWLSLKARKRRFCNVIYAQCSEKFLTWRLLGPFAESKLVISRTTGALFILEISHLRMAIACRFQNCYWWFKISYWWFNHSKTSIRNYTNCENRSHHLSIRNPLYNIIAHFFAHFCTLLHTHFSYCF